MSIKKWIIIGSIALASSLPFSSNAQTNKITKNEIKKELIDNFWNKEKNQNDTIAIKNIDILIENHETIINTNTKDILEEYWESEGLNIINNHLILEINKLRKEQGIPELIEINKKLKTATQKQSEFLNKEWRIYHMKWENILRKRLEKDSIDFLTCWENLAIWQKNIKIVIDDRMSSEWHKRNILNKYFKKIWLWLKEKTRVLYFTN